MCGILLIFSKKDYLNRKYCLNATKKIKSRGPDKLLKKFYFNDKLYIANSILSITGKLKSKNDYLISSQTKNFDIAFNGQIFNWRELNKKYNLKKMSNDTYTLVNLLEQHNNNSILRKLNGMFAYCILDKKKRVINTATDPQGEKKLFYYNDKDYFIISSTISSILQVIRNKKKLNTNKIEEYFTTRHFLFDEKTIYQNIKIFKPGKIYQFDLKDFKIISKFYDNPVNWISAKQMKENINLNNNQIIKKIKDIFFKQLNLMIPSKPFGTIFSGGVDSSLQSAMISNIKKPKIAIALNHVHKDKITENIVKFKKYLKFKLHVSNVKKDNYISNVLKCYEITNFPFLTHDFVGKHQLAEFFRKKKCKVFFAADGADELFGGYNLYNKINWDQKKTKNHSPYSNYKTPNFKDNLWLKAYKKYNFIQNKKERMMHASLFTDYFIQSVYVGNIGTDIMCSNSGIEPRNLFIQKDIIKLALNLPIKYKINFKEKNNKFILKPVLKKLFKIYFNENLIQKKQGFSGFPNEAKSLLGKNKNYNMLKNLKLNYKKYKKYHNFRAYEWKLINIELFLRHFNRQKIQ